MKIYVFLYQNLLIHYLLILKLKEVYIQLVSLGTLEKSYFILELQDMVLDIQLEDKLQYFVALFYLERRHESTQHSSNVLSSSICS